MVRQIFFFLLAATAGLAQTTPILPFGLRFQQGQTLTAVGDGSTLLLPAEAISMPVSGTLSITYRGAAGSSASINSIDLTGSLDFSVSGFSAVPFNIAGGDTITASIRYLPSSGARAAARLTINYTEGRSTSSFSLNLAGVAPDFVFSYTPPSGNAQPVVSGGVIAFGQAVIDTTATATVVIANRGSGAGAVNTVSLTGDAFQLVGAPLAGTLVDGGKDVRFGVNFTPKQVAASTGSVAIALVDRQVSFSLQGTGATSQFTYELISGSGAAVISADKPVALPDTNVNEKSAVIIRVRNTGSADGRISAISASGAGITASDIPALPITLTPNNGFTFTLTFAPTQAGKVTGTMRIGADLFNLSANALGPVLSYAYIVSGVSSTIPGAGSVNFVPTPVGNTATLQFQISNTGTAQGNVTSISVNSTGSGFDINGVAGLPVTLAPGASTTFNVTFTPTVLGAAAGTLRVDAQTFTLNGTGTSPAPLPDYKFEGSSGVQDALQQPAISLTLASAYALNLSGTLTLAFNSDVFANDPSVQFANGGRTVNFTIPANTTKALFPNNATQVRLQTGTVGGSIVLTPSFATDGGINLTPARPATLNLSVPAGAPRALGVSIAAKTSTTITLLVTGYSTSRAVTQMDLQFTPVAGETLSTKSLTLNVESAFVSWYQNANSQPFGSLFTATVPLTLTGEVVSASTIADAVQTIAVTLTNKSGTSSPMSVNLH
ncbi:MAG: choice-of-anchor D domain-containing protein [Bryobacterales bacterium]|nr:choice-of-anchor D domain-containing protein [Bryobacterales bacterium]